MKCNMIEQEYSDYEDYVDFEEDLSQPINDDDDEETYFDRLLLDEHHTEKPIISGYMSDDEFWQIIQESKDESSSCEEQQMLLYYKLLRFSAEEIVKFHRKLHQQAQGLSIREDLYSASRVMCNTGDEWEFYFFCLWVISRGRKVYESAITNPDTLVSEITDDPYQYTFSPLRLIALEAFVLKTGKHMDDVYEQATIEVNSEIHNEPFVMYDFDEMKKRCPRLFTVCRPDLWPNEPYMVWWQREHSK